jgi:EAL domain-containing protein (putative c-di-GMP-specific phosphodiesterase class I)
LQQVVRSSDFVSRFGGDEFIVLLKNINIETVHSTIEDIFNQLISKPAVLNLDIAIDIRMSIGVAIFPEGGKTEDSLISHADISMYAAKKHGRNQVCYFDTNAIHTDDYSLENKIIRSLRNNGMDDFHIVYQPQIALPSLKVTGCESLIRWKDSKNNNDLVPPSLFIPILEANNNMIIAVGEWVLRNTCLKLLNYPQYLACVNISLKQLRDRSFVDKVKRVLADTKFDPHRLELEVTESVFISNVGQTRQILLELVALGIKVSIDDFGSGYSSLNRVISLPITKLKIDGVFMREFTENIHSKQVISAVVKIGKDLGLTVLAEGVETKEQVDYLTSVNCDAIQGFYFSKPLLFEDFLRFKVPVAV